MLILTLSAAPTGPRKKRNVSEIINILVMGPLTISAYICRLPDDGFRFGGLQRTAKTTPEQSQCEAVER
jgi:hypothetical protein